MSQKTLLQEESSRLGKDELNLAEFPFALLASRPPKKPPLRLECRDGTKEWVVEGSASHGLPTAGDIEVYVVLMEITREQNFPVQVEFCRHDLIRRLGWDSGGRTYDRLNQSLDRLVGVTIYSKNAFYDARQKLWERRKAFHILEAYDVTDSRQSTNPERSLFPSWIRWSPELYANIHAGYIKSLDVTLFLSLRSAISQALYRYLDKKRYDGKPLYRMHLKTLVFEHLGLSRNYFPSEAKHKLKPAHEELMAAGFLREVEYARMKDGEEMVVYHFGPRLSRPAALPEPGSELADRLIAAGLSRQGAQALAASAAEECEKQLAYLPYREARDPGAVLAKAIREGWAAPPDWIQAQAQQKARAASQRKRREAAAHSEQAEKDEAAFETWWKQLPAGERQAILADVMPALRQQDPVAAEFASKRPEGPLIRAAVFRFLKKSGRWPASTG